MNHDPVEGSMRSPYGRMASDRGRELTRRVAEGEDDLAIRKRRLRHSGLPEIYSRRPASSAAAGRGAPLFESYVPARVVYDSARSSSSKGVRSAERGSRNVTYRAGSFVVDIQLEVDLEARRVSLAGQVLHVADPLGSVSELPVLLVEGNGDTVARTRTNDAGEFVLEFAAERRLRLAIVLNEKRAIVIPSTEPHSKRGGASTAGRNRKR